MTRNLECDSKDVFSVPVMGPRLLEPGEPEGRHLDVVFDDDAELVVGLGVPSIEPGRPQAVVLLEDPGTNLTSSLR